MLDVNSIHNITDEVHRILYDLVFDGQLILVLHSLTCSRIRPLAVEVSTSYVSALHVQKVTKSRFLFATVLKLSIQMLRTTNTCVQYFQQNSGIYFTWSVLLLRKAVLKRKLSFRPKQDGEVNFTIIKLSKWDQS